MPNPRDFDYLIVVGLSGSVAAHLLLKIPLTKILVLTNEIILVVTVMITSKHKLVSGLINMVPIFSLIMKGCGILSNLCDFCAVGSSCLCQYCR